jgi:hypothetical protein
MVRLRQPAGSAGFGRICAAVVRTARRTVATLLMFLTAGAAATASEAGTGALTGAPGGSTPIGPNVVGLPPPGPGRGGPAVGDLVGGTGGGPGVGDLVGEIGPVLDGCFDGSPPEAEDEDGAYKDVTPLCHYLERGVDDQKPGTMDRHVIAAGEVKSLAQIDRLAFGFDAPSTHCQDDAYGVPCMDEDLDAEWCIGKVRLHVLGMKFFEASAPGPECLLAVRSGKSGLKEISGSELRAHPDWGIPQETLIDLLSFVRFVDGKPRLEIPGALIPGAHLGATIESLVGEYFARENKGCANGTYCGDQRGLILGLADANDTDCDLGGCSATSARKPSPWVEVKRDGDGIRLEIDFEGGNNSYDPDDRVLTSSGQWDHGNVYTELGRGALFADLGLVCEEFARVEDPQCGRFYKLPHCPVGEPTEPCFRRTALFAGGDAGEVDCPAGDDSLSCGREVEFVEPRFDFVLDVLGSGPDLDVEGGLVNVLGGIADMLGNFFLDAILDESLLSQTLFKDLRGCPAHSIAADGSVTVDLESLDACPPGAKNPDCGQGFQVEPTDPNGGELAPGPTFTTGPGGSGGPVGNLPIAGGGTGPGSTAKYWNLAPKAASLAAKGPSQLVGNPPANAGKVKLDTLDDALLAACVATPLCSESFSFSELPLAQVIAIDFDEVKAVYEEEGAEAALEMLEPVTGSEAFQEKCVAFKFPELNPNLGELAWFGLFLDDLEKTGEGSCRETSPSAESLIPASQIVIDVETRGDPVSDGYSFVSLYDLEDHPELSYGARKSLVDKYGCRHLKEKSLPSSAAPVCGSDGEIGGGDWQGERCGTIAGEACSDIGASYYKSMWLYGEGDPAEPEFHPNGDFSRRHRCDFDLETGLPMSCVKTQFTGAGVNETGVCKICGTPGPGDDPELFTQVGCEPENGICPDGTVEWPDGRCWTMEDGLPPWMCEADCEGMYNGLGWCMHDLSWRWIAEDMSPIMAEYPSSDEEFGYGDPICAERFCEGSGMACAAQGMACRPDDDTCELECWDDADCPASDPLPAYPQGFICDFATHTCRLSIVAKPG